MINYLAVVGAAVASFVIGMLWYSPMVFGRKWMQWSGKTEKDINKTHMTQSFAITFVSSLVMAYVLAHFVDYAGATTLVSGALAGFWAWLGFIATTHLGSILWEGKPAKLYGLNMAFHLINLVVMGVILTLWV